MRVDARAYRHDRQRDDALTLKAEIADVCGPFGESKLWPLNDGRADCKRSQKRVAVLDEPRGEQQC